MKIAYKETRFANASLQLIEVANTILETYARRGITVTLRQLYYQFVARDILPNQMKEYKRLGSLINDARLAGLIDWDHMQDRTRNLMGRNHWDNQAQIIEAAAASYHKDLWDGQKNRVEVWIEKDALVGVIERPCFTWDVSYFSCRGYTSQSEMWAAAQRLKRYNRDGRKVTIIHLGDHDPSGKDMSRDIEERLVMFGALVTVDRIALNMDQIRRYNPPPNPAKLTDTRAVEYIAAHGSESWELDALDPDVLIALLESAITKHVNVKRRDQAINELETERRVLTATAKHWTAIESFIRRELPKEV